MRTATLKALAPAFDKSCAASLLRMVDNTFLNYLKSRIDFFADCDELVQIRLSPTRPMRRRRSAVQRSLMQYLRSEDWKIVDLPRARVDQSSPR